MEHLIKLLNEYARECNSEFVYVDYDKNTNSFEVLDDGKVVYLGDETITSLRFGFIDWLFEKREINVGECVEDEDFKTLVKYYDPADAALMVLATRYSSIALLIERLKND